MDKIDRTRLYRSDEVPDHIIHEVLELVIKLGIHFKKAVEGHNSGIAIAAFNRFHAILLVELIDAEGLKDAALSEATALIKNVEYISGQQIFPDLPG